MSDQQAVLTQRIVEEVWRTGDDADIARIVFDVLVRSGIDVRREPTLEEMKRILVSVYRAAHQPLFR